MKDFRILFIFSYCLFATCFYTAEGQNDKSTGVDMVVKSKCLLPDLSNKIDSVICVPLQWDESVIINDITGLELSDNKIAVYEKYTMGAYLFNLKGSYIGKLNSILPENTQTIHSNNSQSIPYEQVYDSITCCTPFLVTENQKYALGYMEAKEFLDEVKNGNRRSSGLYDLASGLTEMDNPVIFIYQYRSTK